MRTRAQDRATAAVEPMPNVIEDDAEKTQPIPDRVDDDILERTQPIPEREEADRALSQEIRNIRALDDHESYPCGICEIKLTENDPSIMCEGGCESWFHLPCANMSEDEFQTIINNSNAFWECAACLNIALNGHVLPPYKAHDISTNKAVWGTLEGLELYEAINAAYDEVVKWNRNLYMVPTGHAGQDFVAEVTKCINYFNQASPLEPIALKMSLLMFPLLLQKPSKKSKSKDHVRCLEERLVLWKKGNLEDLLRKGRVIQRKLQSSKHTDPENTDKIFCRLMLHGKVSAALRWVGDHKSSIHKCTPEIFEKLKNLHPTSKKTSNIATLNGPVDKVEGETYATIDADAIQQCIKHISGAAGPSGADAEMWLRILCTKQLKKRPAELCDAVANLAKKLASELVDPPLTGCIQCMSTYRLVKDIDGVRPIGIGEILHRIVAKAIVKSVNMDVVEATTPIQICSGVPSGVEAAVHAVRSVYDDPNTEGILLVDASNAFNSMNRNVALKNIQVTCPQFSTFMINTYRTPAKLLVRNSDEILLSEEGTTQGDAAAMSFYSCSTMPLIHNLDQVVQHHQKNHPGSDMKQVWYADDSAGGGSLDAIQAWWEQLQYLGPRFGYYPKASKTWLIVKPEHETRARQLWTCFFWLYKLENCELEIFGILAWLQFK